MTKRDLVAAGGAVLLQKPELFGFFSPLFLLINWQLPHSDLIQSPSVLLEKSLAGWHTSVQYQLTAHWWPAQMINSGLISSHKCLSWVTLRCSVSRLSESLRAAAAVGDVNFFLHWEQMLLFDPVEPVDSGCCPSLGAVMENKTQPFYSPTCWMWPRVSSESLGWPVFTSLTRSSVFCSLLFKRTQRLVSVPEVWRGKDETRSAPRGTNQMNIYEVRQWDVI